MILQIIDIMFAMMIPEAPKFTSMIDEVLSGKE
jgi:hypothetical protein